MQTGSSATPLVEEKKKVKKGRKVVSSKIEHTPSPESKASEASGMVKYRGTIRELSEKILTYALSLSPGNLLTVKIVLMDAVREVEIRMKERRT